LPQLPDPVAQLGSTHFGSVVGRPEQLAWRPSWSREWQRSRASSDRAWARLRDAANPSRRRVCWTAS
jgi:hypothetical protein